MQHVDPIREHQLLLTRRQLFGRAALGTGTAALAGLLAPQLQAADSASEATERAGTTPSPGDGHVYDRTWIERPSRGLWVSRSGDEITGFISAEAGAQEPKSLIDPPTPHITGAYLEPEHRRSGASDALLAELFNWTRDSGWEACTVDFETSNPEGSGFWLGRAGFEPLLYTMVRRLDPRYVPGP